MNFRIEAACASHVGLVRGNNEDNFFFDDCVLTPDNRGQTTPLHLFGENRQDVYMAVFDGMGGGDFGEVASYTAASAFRNLLPLQRGNIEQQLQDVTGELNRAVWDARKPLNARQMGTTMAAVCFSGWRAYFCNAGDSRIFILRQDHLAQVSRDHTDEAYMKSHNITGRKPRLTQYLGMDPSEVLVEPYVTSGVPEEGDVILICSDGLTDMVSEERIKEILLCGGTAGACVQALINKALQNGGKDNITVIVCRILEEIRQWSEDDDADASEDSLAGLDGGQTSGWRKFWNRIRDTAETFRK